MHALNDLGDAIDVTRDFLTPVEIWTWLKLALVMLFIGGAGSNVPTSGGNFDSLSEDQPAETPPGVDPGTAPTDPVTDEILMWVAIIAALVLLAIALLMFLRSVFEFVLVESLRSGEVTLRRYFGRNLGRGFRLFLFRLLLWVGLLSIVAGPILYLALTAPSYEAVPLGTIFFIIIGGVVLYLPYLLVMKLTTEFVVPIMLHDNRGVLSAWRRYIGAVRGNVSEYIAYILLSFIIGAMIAVGIVFLFLFVGLFALVIFGILVAVSLLLPSPIGEALAVILGLVGFLIFLLVSALVQVPIVSYLRYYALLVLGDTDADLDLIPDQRSAVRADGGDDTDGPGGPRDPRDSDPGDAGGPSANDGPAGTEDDWQSTGDETEGGNQFTWDDEDGDETGDWDDEGGGNTSGWDDHR